MVDECVVEVESDGVDVVNVNVHLNLRVLWSPRRVLERERHVTHRSRLCETGFVIVIRRLPRPRSAVVSKPYEYEHAGGDDTHQDRRVRNPAEEEYSGRTKSYDDKGKKQW